MTYSVYVHPTAKRGLDALPLVGRGRVEDALHALAHDPRPAGCKKLTGMNAWRVRVGDYRIIYEVDDSEQRVGVAWIGHRKDAYRGN